MAIELHEVPAEIAEARDRAATARSNMDMAEAAYVAARAEVEAAERKASDAGTALDKADQAEAQARRDYVAALRRHGWVQTADGPRPAEVTSTP